MPNRAKALMGVVVLTMILVGGSIGCSLLGSGPAATPEPTKRAWPTQPLIIPTWTPIPSPTPVPTDTPAPSAEQPSGCQPGAAYVSDVTIPDHTKIEPGAKFTKTWEIKNTGSCPWGEGYYLAFVGREQMGAPERVPVPATAPGETTQISVEFQAPEAPGTYRSDWQMELLAEEPRRFGPVIYTVIVVE